jgi:two-component system, OmpR family, sensor histidine kinase KdpD
MNRSVGSLAESMFTALKFGRIALAAGAVAAITLVYGRLLHVNPTTIALSYLVAILGIAGAWGLREATVASVLAAFCFNVFFLPPVGQLTIADPQNWVALFAFLLTAIVTSQLSARARQRTIDAVARQTDLERPYALGRALLLQEDRTGRSVVAGIAHSIADTFELAGVAVYDHRAGIVSRAGPNEIPDVEDRVRTVIQDAGPVRDSSGVTMTNIRLGGEPIGTLAILGRDVQDTVLQSIANLAAIALEQARGKEAAARAEAARESGELRATVLDALAHEFKTPLTSVRAASSDLLSTVADHTRERELALIIDEASGRLQALVSDVVQMLRIDAGRFAVHLERHPLAGLVAASLADVRTRLDGHEVVTNVPSGVLVDVDADLVRLALRQMLDNAARYSPPGSRIEVAVSSNAVVEISVRNSGTAIPAHEQLHVFERFFRGTHARHVPGTGMGLAIVQQIARAHGGQVIVTSSESQGTVFTLSLPKGGRP